MKRKSKNVIILLLVFIFAIGVFFIAFNKGNSILGAIKLPGYTTDKMSLHSYSLIELDDPNAVGSGISSVKNNVSKTKQEGVEVSVTTDYMHASGKTVCLGNNESAMITIKDPDNDIAADQFTLVYDEKLLSAEIQEIKGEEAPAFVEIRISCESPCKTSVAVYPGTVSDPSAENTANYHFDIEKLDSTNGRVVYVTPTGAKYHFSEACAGENAIITTLFDASKVYDLCGKCKNK